MSDSSSHVAQTWRPDTIATHRLLQLSDVLVISRHRFQRLSICFSQPNTSNQRNKEVPAFDGTIPSHSGPDRACLVNEYHIIKNKALPWVSNVPRAAIAALRDEAISEVVRSEVGMMPLCSRRSMLSTNLPNG